ncbi:RNA polymerase sigma factor [Enhygromyxa salina]|uniref:ECF RNA polymerase sigma factor SigW n=1 Tax=Enhygromyxa salina TaxID=215803 RepID=A0A2S9Y4H7_9BACT|nr:RNA polymerase sigma factor [Enhygromyxa salina]PRP99975.1 ECF RNA polymerase sigma factor SigW [Enhygromyxa salina]
MEGEAELLSAWRRGDLQAGNELFHRHYGAVRRFLANKVDNDLEDLLQRTFEICAKGKDGFEGRSSFRTYLLGIARNLVLQHWEGRHRGRAHENIEEFAIHDLGAGPSTLLARSEAHRRLLEALRRLPLKHQVVLELSFWEELPGGELGEVLGVPEDTARSRLRRAKLQLTKQLNHLERSASAMQSTSDDLEQWAASVRAQLRAGSARALKP